MDSELAPLRLGCPVRFRDRWEGHLWAFEVEEGWEVINVVAKRGLLRSSSVRLPFSAASGWSRDDISFSCSSGEAFGRRLAPVAAPARTLSARTAVEAPGARLVGALVERRKRRVAHLLIRQGVAPAREYKAAADQVSFKDSRLLLAVQVKRLPVYRSDEELGFLVREALASHPRLTADDRRALTMEVSDGVVRLAGNVRTTQARDWAEQAAASVDGAAALRNEVADDIHLELSVAQALDRAGLFRTALVQPRSALGEVTLFGHAASAGAVAEIMRLASGVPGVRWVTSRLEVG